MTSSNAENGRVIGTKRLPVDIAQFAERLWQDVDRFPIRDGNWKGDSGDACYFGLIANLNRQPQKPRLLDSVFQYDYRVLRRAGRNNVELVMLSNDGIMSAFGIIECVGRSRDARPTIPGVTNDEVIAAVDVFLDRANGLLEGMGGYADTHLEIGTTRISLGAALTRYGPTVTTAVIAILNLHYAKYVQTDRVQERLACAKRIINAVNSKAYDGEKYLFNQSDKKLYLYPNAMMIIALVRLYEQTSDEQYLVRAKQTAKAIKSLKKGDHGGYRSPYLGRTLKGAISFSSQNYLVVAFVMLYVHTKDSAYYDEAIGLLRFIQGELYDPAKRHIRHHMPGGGTPCVGCQLQYLYIIQFAKRELSQELSR